MGEVSLVSSSTLATGIVKGCGRGVPTIVTMTNPPTRALAGAETGSSTEGETGGSLEAIEVATGVGMMGMIVRGDQEGPVVVMAASGVEDGMIAVRSPGVVDIETGEVDRKVTHRQSSQSSTYSEVESFRKYKIEISYYSF